MTRSYAIQALLATLAPHSAIIILEGNIRDQEAVFADLLSDVETDRRDLVVSMHTTEDKYPTV